MKIVDAKTPGGPEVLRVYEVPRPTPKPGEVLIEVHGIGVNRADLLQRAGLYPPPAGAPSHPGLEVSGVVAAIAPKPENPTPKPHNLTGTNPTTQAWKVGDKVMALLSGGGYGEYVCVAHDLVLPAPQGLPLLHAAALPEGLATVWSTLFGEGLPTPAANLKPVERVLIHGGAGGVGVIALQMAKLAGAQVAVTVGSDQGAALCESLDADLVINYRQQNFTEVITKTWGGVDVVFDVVGAAYLKQNIQVLNVGGRLAIIGMQKGTRGELNLNTLLTKRLAIIGTTLRSRPLSEKAVIMQQVNQFMQSLPATKKIRAVIDQIFDLSQADQAHEHMAAGSAQGKILLNAKPTDSKNQIS